MASEVLVDVIKEGEILTVSEAVAREEDLFILRRHESLAVPTNVNKRQIQPDLTRNDFKTTYSSKPEYKNNNVLSELIDNFHWEISKARKRKNLSRRLLGEAVGEPEEVIKRLENGELPSDDFILINKIQQQLGLNLRKDGKNFSMATKLTVPTPGKDMPKDVSLSYLQRRKEEQEKKNETTKKTNSFSGSDIELVD